MNWSELTVSIPSSDVERASAIATMAAPYGFSIEDYSDMDEMLPVIGRVDYVDAELLGKDRTRAALHIYLPEDTSPAEVSGCLEALLGAAGIPFELSCERVNDEDWAENWKRFYKPERIGDRLVVCPSWERYERQPGDVVMTMDPGAAFGSGKHETTALCLRLIEANVNEGDRVLDMGCGSGILSIAAALLGCAHATAVDVDENAVKTALANARDNGLGADVYEAHAGNILEDAAFLRSLGDGYDMICANIVADVVMAMGGMFWGALKQGGALLVSGIIDPRADEVSSSLASRGFVLQERLDLGGWSALRLVKPIQRQSGR